MIGFFSKNKTKAIFKQIFNDEIVMYILITAMVSSTYSLYLSPLKIYGVEKFVHIPKTIFLLSMVFLSVNYCYKIVTEDAIFDKNLKYINYLILIVSLKWILILFSNKNNLNQNESFLSNNEFIKIIFNLVIIATFMINKNKLKIDRLIIPYLISLSIPTFILFFTAPHMIGVRLVNFRGIIFDGGYWNSTVIAFISTGWIVLYLLHAQESVKLRIFYVLYLTTIGLISLTSLSRIVILSLILSLSIFLLYSDFSKIILSSKQKIFIIVLFLIIIFIFWEPLSSSLFRFKYMFMNGNFKNESRIKVWSSYIQEFHGYWFIGYFNNNIDTLFSGFNPHNIFINFAIRYGILAPILLIIFLFKLLLQLKKNRYKNFFLASFVSYMTIVMINQTGFIEPQFYIQLGILTSYVSVSHIYDKR